MNPNKEEKAVIAGTNLIAIKLFDPLKPFIKNWRKFLQDIGEGAETIFFEEELKAIIKTTSETEATVYGEQVGGYRPGMGMSGEGLNPPEFDETQVDVPDEVEALVSIKMKYRELIKDLMRYVKSDLNDPRGFQEQFLQLLSRDKKFQSLFIVFLKTALNNGLKDMDEDFWSDSIDLENWVKNEIDYTLDTFEITGYSDKLLRVSMGSSDVDIAFKVILNLDVEIENEDNMGRYAGKWDSLPKGWTQDSLKKFWSSLTGDKKHKVTACIKKMEGKIDNPGAFCASLNDKIDPGWRSRGKKKKASDQLASRWIMKTAAAGPFDPYTPLVKQMVGAIFLYLLKYQQQDPTADKAPYAKAFVSGFIIAMFSDLKPRDTQLVNTTFKLLERMGPVEHGEMLNTHSLSKKYAGLIRKTGGAVIAATIAVELLKKSRQLSAASKLERLLAKLLASELAKGLPGKTKKETEAQVLKRLVLAEMPQAKKFLQAMYTKHPETVRAYVSAAFDDANWPTGGNKVWDEPNDEDVLNDDLVTKINQHYNYGIEDLTIFGIAILSLVNNRAGISILKNIIKTEFPEHLQDEAKTL